MLTDDRIEEAYLDCEDPSKAGKEIDEEAVRSVARMYSISTDSVKRSLQRQGYAC